MIGGRINPPTLYCYQYIPIHIKTHITIKKGAFELFLITNQDLFF